jgi:hypothetical protein
LNRTPKSTIPEGDSTKKSKELHTKVINKNTYVVSHDKLHTSNYLPLLTEGNGPLSPSIADKIGEESVSDILPLRSGHMIVVSNKFSVLQVLAARSSSSSNK